MPDIEARRIRLIGDPETRYREDPVRMLRAVRLAAKLDLEIHPEAAAPMARLGGLIDSVPPARLFDEFLKIFETGPFEQGNQKLGWDRLDWLPRGLQSLPRLPSNFRK